MHVYSPFFLSLQKFPKVLTDSTKEEAEHEQQIASPARNTLTPFFLPTIAPPPPKSVLISLQVWQQ